jgi:hypothetical protein
MPRLSVSLFVRGTEEIPGHTLGLNLKVSYQVGLTLLEGAPVV